MPITLDDCRDLDKADPLAAQRRDFALPEGIIYLDGNSLGALPKRTSSVVADAIQRQWGQDLITSWNKHDWIGAPRRVASKISRLIGAEPDEVVVCDSTSLNLFKVLASALALRPQRRVVISDSGNFPTDLYMAQGITALLGKGHELRVVQPEAVAEALDENVAVLMLTEVDYRTGRRHQMKELTARAHASGALAIWDLAHSAGAFLVDLKNSGADFAVGCGYKYLNGGPGAPAFLYVRRTWLAAVNQPLFGWMGHAAPFNFDLDYHPKAGVDRFLVGTPPILSLLALEAGLAVFDGIDLEALRRKSMALGDLMIDLVDQETAKHGLALASPRKAEARGSQVSFCHPEGYAIVQALIARGVIGDFRAPDIMRFGFAPLYLGFEDLWRAVQAIKVVLERREWDRPEYRKRAAVT
jgi:kynureninase